jgi:hypothetical protein
MGMLCIRTKNVFFNTFLHKFDFKDTITCIGSVCTTLPNFWNLFYFARKVSFCCTHDIDSIFNYASQIFQPYAGYVHTYISVEMKFATNVDLRQNINVHMYAYKHLYRHKCTCKNAEFLSIFSVCLKNANFAAYVKAKISHF